MFLNMEMNQVYIALIGSLSSTASGKYNDLTMVYSLHRYYEEESVNRSQIDIKRKISGIKT
jgi:hypothetical protein